MMTIVFVRSIIFTESSSLSHQTEPVNSAVTTVVNGCHRHALRLICCKYCASECGWSWGKLAATWGRVVGPGWEKHNTERGPAMPASLCAPAMPCEMTGRVTEWPGAFFPLWPVKAHQLVGSQFETDWEMTFSNFLRDDRVVQCFPRTEGVCVSGQDDEWSLKIRIIVSKIRIIVSKMCFLSVKI